MLGEGFGIERGGRGGVGSVCVIVSAVMERGETVESVGFVLRDWEGHGFMVVCFGGV